MATQETKVNDVHDTMKTVIVENNATLTSRVSLDPPDMVHLVFGETFQKPSFWICGHFNLKES